MSNKKHQEKTDIETEIELVEERKKKRVNEERNFGGKSHEDFKELDHYDEETLKRMKLMIPEDNAEK
ncbi:MAG: hypothetical protein IJX37_07135 [Oscillospiraceae bacterium]|nr:hypothetical protein [Oscillospiraceae bacterium]